MLQAEGLPFPNNERLVYKVLKLFTVGRTGQSQPSVRTYNREQLTYLVLILRAEHDGSISYQLQVRVDKSIS